MNVAVEVGVEVNARIRVREYVAHTSERLYNEDGVRVRVTVRVGDMVRVRVRVRFKLGLELGLGLG